MRLTNLSVASEGFEPDANMTLGNSFVLTHFETVRTFDAF